MKSNPHNDFSLTPFNYFEFQHPINFVREKIILQDPDGKQHILPIKSHKKQIRSHENTHYQA